jgi:acyl-CoA thioester hydrolase
VSFSFGHPTGNRPPFKYSAYTRVGFSDTDAQGIVYYGRYMPYFDIARVEYARHLGVLAKDLQGCDFVMRASQVLYEAPARFDDLLEVYIRTKRLGRTSMTAEFCVLRLEDGVLMCTAEQTLVLIDPGHRRPVAIPEDYRAALETFEGADLELGVAR